MIRRFTILLALILLFFELQGYSQSIVMSNDTTICLGDTTKLSATVTSGSYGTTSYTFDSIAYNPESFSGGTSVCGDFNACSSTAGGKDDCIAGPYPIGFDFCFFNHTYTQFWIGSNGWISFSQPPITGLPPNQTSPWDTFTATTIPNTASSVPRNVIFFPWEDWLPCKGLSLNVNYYTEGSAPNRKLVVNFSATTFFNCNGSQFATFQAVLNEQTSIIENHIQSKPQCGTEGATQGVQDSTGTIAFWATGRNDTPWSATNESTRFVPSGLTWYTGGYPGGTIAGYGSPISFNPTVTTAYTAVVQLCDGTTAQGNVTVTVDNPQFTYSQSDYCQSDPDPTPTIVTSGGIFTSSPPGLVFLSAATGAINLGASAPGTYIINYTLPFACTSMQTVNVIGTPAPPVPLASYVSRCDTGQVTFGVIQQSGSTITWYDAATGGNLLPFAGPTVTTSITATSHYYAEAKTNATNCTSLSRTEITAVVKSLPVITNNIFNYTVCSRDSIKITLTSTVPSSTFQWTAFSSSSGTLTGYSGGSGSKIQQKLVNSGVVNDTVIYSVVTTADTCTSDTVKFTVAVRPLFDLTVVPLSQTICSNNLITINLSSTNPSTTFSWTATGSNPNLSGFLNGSGGSISQTLLNSGTTDGTVTYKIVPQGSGCTGDTTISTVLVHPLPVPVITGAPSICVGSSGVSYSTRAGMTNYQWAVSAGGTITSGGTTNSNNVTVTWNTPGAQTVSVNYHDVNSCTAAAPTVYPVTVNPLPGIPGSITGTTALCQGSTGIAYSIGAVPNTTSYNWILLPVTAGTISGNTMAITINWSAAFTGSATLTVQGVNSCGVGNLSPALSILVNPNPIVSYIFCTDSITTPTAGIINLREGIPLGGTWSGIGVNPVTSTFNPAIAGLGTHVITYSYANVNGCINVASHHITIVSPGVFFCGGTMNDVRDGKTYQTIQIGSQCWMSENLNFGTMIPGSVFQRDNCVPEKYCYNNNTANCGPQTYYQWDELMTYTNVTGTQGICPPGWHVPSEPEWNILFSNFIDNGFAGSALKSTGYSGFNALVSGADFFNRNYYFNTFAGIYWSSDAHGPYKAWAHGMNSFDPSVSYYPAIRSNAFSVRCIMN